MWRPSSAATTSRPHPAVVGGLALAILLLILTSLTAFALYRLDDPQLEPVGAAGVGRGRQPVVLIAGLMSDGDGFRRLTGALAAGGIPVLDFDPVLPGTQPLTYRPASSGQHVPSLAAKVVQPALRSALARGGFDPATQRIDVVAHSLGGLLMRFLIEQPGADVDSFSATGWSGDGVPDVEPGWAAQVDDLVMVATPNHGSWLGATLAAHEEWKGVAGDFQPGSAFLKRMGKVEPPGQVYTAIGGNPWPLRWYRRDHDADGRAHGFDGVVPAESPYLAGAVLDIYPFTHGRLLASDDVVRLIVDTLQAGS